ncbi:MAG: LysM peptidoglycan-binding domain-containing protein [Ardenticatenaceae bacterium]|nr:LysM peptidoglycan-binding domain-containing protein [Ardenticatenaceae bacterium]
MSNYSKFIIHDSLFLFLMALLLSNCPLVKAQDFPTPTPDAEGNIFVIVQPNDSLWAIAARAGIPLADLLALNNLTENSIIAPGDQLLIGRAEPAATPTEPLPPPSPTATRPPPPPTATAVPPPPTAICLKAFTDLNRDGKHNAGEPFKAAVAFTIFTTQAVVANYVTDGISEPHCLENLPPGDYNITRSIAQGETLTTQGDWTISLAPYGGARYSAVPHRPLPPSPFPRSKPPLPLRLPHERPMMGTAVRQSFSLERRLW